MGKPNTKPFDRMIAAAENKLKRAQAGEISVLSSSEKARFALHTGRGVRRVVRGKSTSDVDRLADRVFEEAAERYAAELLAAQNARQAVINEAAAAKVAKRAESKFW